jgi:hypothetical protein
MPSLDAYADVQLTDVDGIDCWLLAHNMRHMTYQKAASLQGVSVPPYDFEAPPDDDWFARHMNAHYALQSFMAPDPTISIAALANYNWDDEDDFDTWMQMHTLMHRRLDEGFGIF